MGALFAFADGYKGRCGYRSPPGNRVQRNHV